MPQRKSVTRMLVPTRCWLAAAVLLCVSVSVAFTQGNVMEREVKAVPGRDARVGVFTDIRPDCTSGPLPAIRLVMAPAHGAVSVKRGTLKATNFKQCLATEVPVFVAFYRAKDGFSGADEFVLEIAWASGRKELQHFRVNVSSTPAGREGI